MSARAISQKALTAWRLGPRNIARVAAYKAQLRLGRGVAAIAPRPAPTGPFFAVPARIGDCPVPPVGLPTQFGWLEPPLRADGRPDWFANAATGQRVTQTTADWFKLPDFDPAVGDIKFIWEWSRFDWVLRLAQHLRANGDTQSAATLNDWLADWLTLNPPYRGPNWKCGQEASIRVLHVWLSARVLGSVPSQALLDLVALHLARIAPTMSYAIAQDNNHGTSEGAALFIGGTWLAAVAPSSFGRDYADLGRRLLENRARRLFMTDGTFAQYSVNYHRMALDALSFAELARRDHDAAPFSDIFYARVQAATHWLHAVVDPQSGEAPLLGANDGARLAPFSDSYRDMRPSLVRAAALFLSASPLGIARDDDMRWLGLPMPERMMPVRASQLCDDGGFCTLVRGDAVAHIRYPRFRFRPNQADLLHVDLWLGSDNRFCDGGSYSYNADGASMRYFSGTASHNTIQFDARDQMTRLSRFLFGDWLTARDVAFDAAGQRPHLFQAGYRDSFGASHTRRVTLDEGRMIVSDTIAGFREAAVLRWRLGPGTAQAEARSVRHIGLDGRRLDISIDTAGPVRRAGLVRGEISTHYGQRSPIDVFEVELSAPTTVVSTITWTAATTPS
jgi:hypothetical protein